MVCNYILLHSIIIVRRYRYNLMDFTVTYVCTIISICCSHIACKLFYMYCFFLEPLAYISNGIQLPTKAVYNARSPAPIQLICAGTNGNLELQIETDHEDLPLPLNPGLHYTTNGMEILVNAFVNGIFIDINMEGLLDRIEFSCVSLQSKAIATFLITTGTHVNEIYSHTICFIEINSAGS